MDTRAENACIYVCLHGKPSWTLRSLRLFLSHRRPWTCKEALWSEADAISRREAAHNEKTLPVTTSREGDDHKRGGVAKKTPCCWANVNVTSLNERMLLWWIPLSQITSKKKKNTTHRLMKQSGSHQHSGPPQETCGVTNIGTQSVDDTLQPTVARETMHSCRHKKKQGHLPAASFKFCKKCLRSNSDRNCTRPQLGYRDVRTCFWTDCTSNENKINLVPPVLRTRTPKRAANPRM